MDIYFYFRSLGYGWLIWEREVEPEKTSDGGGEGRRRERREGIAAAAAAGEGEGRQGGRRLRRAPGAHWVEEEGSVPWNSSSVFVLFSSYSLSCALISCSRLLLTIASSGNCLACLYEVVAWVLGFPCVRFSRWGCGFGLGSRSGVWCGAWWIDSL